MTQTTMTGMSEKLAIFLFVLVSLLAHAAAAQQKDWQALADADPLLQAMRSELERSKSELKLEQMAALYYIEYRVIDTDQYSADSAFGALHGSVRVRFRILRVVVRVGDYKQDSYTAAGMGTINVMPLDDDVLALRNALWLATDRAYKAATEALTAKQSQLKKVTVDQPIDDFAHANPVHSVASLAKLEFDTEPWTKMLQDASGLYKTDPQIEVFESSLKFQAVNRYLVNSEGTVVRSGQNLYETGIWCNTQSEDTMRLERTASFAATSVKELPSASEFVARAAKLAGTLKELRGAPVVEEEYRGPVLFSADAAATVFADLVGENILGEDPGLGRNARTTGDFAASYKSRVLPDFLSVVDDPTIFQYRGQPLLGHYEIDDEGVPAQRVAVIEKATL